MRFSTASLLLLLTLLMSACTSTPKTDDDAYKADDLKSISKDITGLVDVPSNLESQPIATRDNKHQPMGDVKNTYLEQEALRMSGVPEEVIATYQQALVLMAQQKWQAAIELFDQVIAKQANLSGSYVNKALILRELHKQQQETKNSDYEQWIDKAISVNPLNLNAHYLKGQILQERGQFAQAEKSYATALSIWPNYTQAQLSMAVLLELYRGKLLDAYQYYSAYLTLEAEDKQVQRWQAALAIKIKRAGLALPVQRGE
ncbi:MAG: hypothetical protein OQK09_13470 [Colwellia sp.]|nr:hypothetical protein [Colwellia sp.]MCW8865301.1 hypothetical protein [Colwellia sp.]MCW9082515.1 hypothetical protein [Colwellia sp.]